MSSLSPLGVGFVGGGVFSTNRQKQWFTYGGVTHRFSSNTGRERCDSLSIRTVWMGDLVSRDGLWQAKLCSDYPNLAIVPWLTTPQKPVKQLTGSSTVLFYTCWNSKGRPEEEFEALKPTLVHRGGQKNYSMWESQLFEPFNVLHTTLIQTLREQNKRLFLGNSAEAQQSQIGQNQNWHDKTIELEIIRGYFTWLDMVCCYVALQYTK